MRVPWCRSATVTQVRQPAGVVRLSDSSPVVGHIDRDELVSKCELEGDGRGLRMASAVRGGLSGDGENVIDRTRVDDPVEWTAELDMRAKAEL